MRNILILCSVLLIAIMAIAAKYFTTLASKDNNITRALNFIPGNATLVLSFNNDESFYEIFKDYKLFNAITGTQRESQIKEIQQFITQPALTEYTSDKKVFISFHPVADSVEFLFTMNLDNRYSDDDLKESFSGISDLTLVNKEKSIYVVKRNHPFFVHVEQGLALASFSESFLNSCLNKKTALSAAFIEEINKSSTRNQSSPINLFINHHSVSTFMMHFLTGERSGNIDLLRSVNGISSLSMNYKSDALMFNGISTTDTTSVQYFNLFLHQHATSNSIKNILPQNTSNFIAFGLSDVNLFRKDLNSYLKNTGQLNSLEAQVKSIQTNTGVNLKRDLDPLWDKEFVTVENYYGEKLVILKVANGRNVNFTLQLISRPVSEQIYQLNYSNILYYYFGDPLKNYVRPYFAVADNYLVVANTPGVISNYLSDYENERFLSNTDGFKNYDQLVATQSNILYFIHNKNSKRIIQTSLKKKYSTMFSDKNYGLKDFYGLSYQWTADGDHFFTNLYLSYPAIDTVAVEKLDDEQ